VSLHLVITHKGDQHEKAPDSSNDLELTGKKVSADHATFRQSIPMASPVGDYPSIVTIPTSGCWQVQLQSGTFNASVTVWVV
jgi:hypothetical protein